MREILDPLAHIPGVRLAALISPDGVPIAAASTARNRDGHDPAIDRDETLNGYTGMAAGWLAEVARTVRQQSWDAPTRAVLRATQGTMVLHLAPDAVVFVVLDRGVPYEELRVPIEGAIARMQRVIRSQASKPPGPLPSPAEGLTEAPAVQEESRKSKRE